MKRFIAGKRGLALWAILISSGVTAWGAEAVVDRAEKPPAPDAKGMVKSALEAEAKGQTADRRAMLDAALRAAPNDSDVHWQRGEVQLNGFWVKPEQSSEMVKNDARIPEYERQRAAAGNTVAGQLALADWCHANQLFDQERVHLTAILKTDSQNPAIAARLGLVAYQGRLLTPAQVEAEKRKVEQVARSAKDWKPRIAVLHRQFTSNNADQKQAALKELRALDQLDAVPALESALKSASGDWGREGVLAISRMPEHVATEALARLSVVADNADIRSAAADALSARRVRHFAPILLAGLRFPVESKVEVKLDDNGARFEHKLTQEGVERDEAKVSQVSLGLTMPNPYYNFFTRDALAAVQDRAEQAESDVRKSNAAIAKRNDRVYAALERSTGAKLPRDPRSWITWWNKYNDIYANEDRYVEMHEVVYQYNVPYYLPRKTYLPTAPQAVGSNPVTPSSNATSRISYQTDPGGAWRQINIAPASCDGCFAAGTPVWTLRGPQPIESLKAGDRVLAQNGDTGELTYKPVLDTTHGEGIPTLRLTVGGGTLVTTLGHEFWVDGLGWRLAKELKVGDRLHASDGEYEVERVEAGQAIETYNLVVADFHDYFVGASRILAHDITGSEYSPALVPGLVLERGEKLAGN